MPIFRLNKLVRDKLKSEYERDGQKAIYRKLTEPEYKSELIRKIIEEAQEIKVDSSKEDILNEIADLQQVLDDLTNSCGFTNDQVESVKSSKNERKGGFSDAVFVETLELSDDDKWIEYYRQHPDIFAEIKE